MSIRTVCSGRSDFRLNGNAWILMFVGEYVLQEVVSVSRVLRRLVKAKSENFHFSIRINQRQTVDILFVQISRLFFVENHIDFDEGGKRF